MVWGLLRRGDNTLAGAGSPIAVSADGSTVYLTEADTITISRGEEVSFDASSSDLSAQEAPVTAVEWDLDGDGSYETAKATTADIVKRTYATPGTYQVGLRVKADGGVPPVTDPVF